MINKIWVLPLFHSKIGLHRDLHLPGRIRIILCFFLVSLLLTGSLQAEFSHFITRSSDKLYDGTTEFRFLGYNMADLAQSWRGGIHTPDPWEQEDAICTISQAGGRAVRIMMLSVRKAGEVHNIKYVDDLVLVDGQYTLTYSEPVLRGLDKALQLANAYGVRVIIPIIGVGSEPRGGAKDFAAFRGCTTQAEFFTNSAVKADFKSFLSMLVNRTNYYTGVQYKNDKAILCWELGNELVASADVDAWAIEMAAYLKSIDPNHLIMDGKCSNSAISAASLSDANIDIVTSHLYYSHTSIATTARNSSRGIKPIIFGEFGYADVSTFSALVQQVIADGSSGAMLWNMAYRHKNGGFYWENANDRDPYRAYRWPGIAGVGTAFQESDVLNMMYTYSYKIVTGSSTPPALPVPDAPQIVPIASKTDIRWRGSVGATSYKIFRATNFYGPFTEIGTGLVDVPTDPTVSYSGFIDPGTLTPDTLYYYKMKAANPAGNWSNESNVTSFTNPTTVVVDNSDAGFSLSGAWTTSASAGYNGSYLHDGAAGAEPTKWARWTPTIATAGSYDVYMHWVANSNRPDAAPLEIVYSGGTDISKSVNQQINGSQWNYIGTYTFSAGSTGSVKILSTDSGYTIADAVKFVKNTPSPILLYENFEDGVLDGWTVGTPYSNLDSVWADHDATNDGVLVLNKPSGEVLVSAGDPTWTNYSAETTATILSATNSLPGIVFRRVDDANHYLFRLTSSGTNQVQLYKRVNGLYTLISQVPFSITTGTAYSMKVVVNGTAITCSINGTTVITATDTTFSAGNVGFRVLNGKAQFGKMIVLR